MEGYGRGGPGMGKGGGGGASGVKSRVKLTVLLLGAMVTSFVFVIGWETSPLSAFLLDPRKHTTRILPGRKRLQPFPSLHRTGRTNEGIEPADLLCCVVFCVWWLPACYLQLDHHV